MVSRVVVAINVSFMGLLMGVRVIKVVMRCFIVVVVEAIEVSRVIGVGGSNSRGGRMWVDIGDHWGGVLYLE